MCESVFSIDFTPKNLPHCSVRESAVLSNSVAELEDWGEEQLVIMRCLLLEEGEEENRRHTVQSRTLTCTQGRGISGPSRFSPPLFPLLAIELRPVACGGCGRARGREVERLTMVGKRRRGGTESWDRMQ